MAQEIFTRVGRLLRIKNQKATNFTNENDTYLTVLVKTTDGVRCLMFTDAEITKAAARAEKNKEDQPKQSWISKLLD